MDHAAEGHFHPIEMDIKILVSCVIESLLDVFRSFRADFEVGQTRLLNFAANLFRIDLPLLAEITLIAEEYNYGFFFLVVVAEVDPLIETIEGFDISDYSRPYW